MADNSNNIAGPDAGDQNFLAARAPANSDEAQLAVMKKQLGWTEGASAQPVPEMQVPGKDTAAAQAPVQNTQSADPEAQLASGNTNSPEESHPVLDFIKGQAGLISSEAKFVKDLPGNFFSPQSSAGIMDVASRGAQTVHDVANSLDDWAQRQGVPWHKLINPDTKVDMGGYFAPTAKTPEEHLQRNIGQIAALFVASSASSSVAGALGATGKLAQFGTHVSSSAALAYAAFDPNERIFSNLIQNNPSLANPVTEWLSSKPGDSAATGRLKNALEMAGVDTALAAAFMGLSHGVKMLRAMNAGSSAAEGGAEAAAGTPPPPPAPGAGTQNVPPEVQAPTSGETVNADQATQQASLQKITTPPAESPQTAAQAFVEKAKPILESDRANLATPEGIKAFKKYFNLKAQGLAESDIAPSLMKNAEAFSAAQGAPITNAESAQKGLDMLLQNPEKVLNQPVAGDLAAKNMAAGMAVRHAAEVSVEMRDKFLELAKTLPDGHPDLVKAAAEFANSQDILYRYAGANKAIGTDVAQGLQARTAVAQDIAAQYANKALRYADKTKGFYSSMQEAVNAAKQLQDMHMDLENEVQHAARISNDMKFGSVPRAIQNLYMENMLSGPASIIRKVGGDVGMGVLRPIETGAAAAIHHVTSGLEFLDTKFSGFLSDVTGKEIAPLKAMEPYTATDADLEKYFGTYDAKGNLKPADLSKVTSDDIAAFENRMNQPATFAKAGYEIRGSLKGVTDQLSAIWKGMGEGKIVGNTDASNVLFKQAVDKLTPEEYANLDVPQKAVYWLSNRGPVKAIYNEVTGFFTAVGREAEKYGSAYDYAKANTSQGGDFRQMFNQLLAEPNQPMKQMMMETGQKGTFTQPLRDGIWKNVIEGMKNPEGAAPGSFNARTSGLNPLKIGLAPIANIGVNITSEAVQRMPGFSLLSREFRDAIAAGGQRSELAMGRLAVGTLITGYGASLALEGRLIGSGPKDPIMKKIIAAEGGGPDMVKIGDRWVPMKSFGVAGKLLKVAADGVELGAYRGSVGEQDLSQYLTTGVAMSVDNVTPDFITGDITNFLELVRDPTSREAKNYFENKVNTLSPGGPLLRSMARVGSDNTKFDTSVDPNSPHPFWEKLLNDYRANVPEFAKDAVGPGKSPELPPQLGIWGQEMHYPSWLGLGPVNVSPTAGMKDKDQSVENEMIRLGIAGPLFKPEIQPGEEHLHVTLPTRNLLIGKSSVPLSPWQYHDLVKLSVGDMGPAVRAGIMSQAQADEMQKSSVRETLKQMIKSPGWASENENQKKIDIAHTFNLQKNIGKQYLQQIYPQLREDAINRRQQVLQNRSQSATPDTSARMPVL